MTDTDLLDNIMNDFESKFKLASQDYDRIWAKLIQYGDLKAKEGYEKGRRTVEKEHSGNKEYISVSVAQARAEETEKKILDIIDNLEFTNIVRMNSNLGANNTQDRIKFELKQEIQKSLHSQKENIK